MNNNNRFKENADDKKNNIDKECLKKRIWVLLAKYLKPIIRSAVQYISFRYSINKTQTQISTFQYLKRISLTNVI